MTKQFQTKRPKKRPQEYVEGREAQENFEKAMTTLFRTPKVAKKLLKGKDWAGKPANQVCISIVVSTVEQMDTLTKKLASLAPDGSQNQIESNTAIRRRGSGVRGEEPGK